ncbi:ATP-binding protein [Oceanobacillus massiliensis]|uniref:ATP-binding protein n=1 Tax=Oceanobacillus massiliensis TaxID=1465765 RepID=UPI003018B7A6
MDIYDLLVKIELLIASKREGDFWDFKEKHHSNKADLLHDIICMANNRADKDGYIIFGVSDDYEIKGTENDENRRNQQGIIDFLKSKKFSGGIRPTIEMKTLDFYDKQVDVLIIKNSTDTPFFILDDYSDKKRKVRANAIYTRTGDVNTDIDKSADINHIEYLWKKRGRH